MAYTGRKFSSQTNHKLEEIYLATVNDAGETFPKVNAALSYESMQIRHLQQDAELLTTETIGQVLDSGGPWNHAHKIGAKGSSIQADNVTWWNVIKAGRGACAIYGKNKSGQFINLIPQTTEDFADSGTTDGSLIDGLTLNGTKRTNSKTERKIEYMAQGQAFPVNYAWLYNSTQLSAYATGTATTGGRSLADASAAPWVRPGFRDLTPAGATGFGFFEECTLVEELVGTEIMNGIYVINDVKITLSFAGKQLDGPQALAHGAYAMTEYAWVLNSLAAETFTFPSGTLHGTFKITSGYSGPKVEGELTATVPMNTADASPNHISGVTATAMTYTY